MTDIYDMIDVFTADAPSAVASADLDTGTASHAGTSADACILPTGSIDLDTTTSNIIMLSSDLSKSTIDTVTDINMSVITPTVATPAVPAEPVKKRPGRPPKKRPGQPPVQKFGIVPTPADCNNNDVIEIVHDKPQLFKDIWTVIKGYHSQEIIIHFEATQIIFYALDRTREFHIHARIDAKFLGLYYCKYPVKMSVKYNDLASVMETISPSHYQITIIARENECRARFYVVLNNTDRGKIKAQVSVTASSTDIPPIPADNSFLVWFRQNRKQFKKLIGDWTKNKTQMFSIEKNGTFPLQFQQISDSYKKENLVFAYPDEVINLQTRLPPNHIFNVTIKIDAVKAFASANAGEDIFFYVNNREIVFKSYLDKQKCGTDICQIDVVSKIRSVTPGQLNYLPDNV